MELQTVAHRAGNDLAALHRAEQAGADFVEVDVHLFRSRLEARHLKTVGPLRLYWDRWEVRPPATAILAFEDLIRSTSTPLLVDLKGGAAALGGRVAEALEGRCGETWICSRRWRHLEALRDRSGLRVIPSAGSAKQLDRLLRRYGPGELDGVSVSRKLLNPHTVDELRRRTDAIFTWRVNDLDTARQVQSWGVTGLITDRYDLLGAFRSLSSGAPGSTV